MYNNQLPLSRHSAAIGSISSESSAFLEDKHRLFREGDGRFLGTSTEKGSTAVPKRESCCCPMHAIFARVRIKTNKKSSKRCPRYILDI